MVETGHFALVLAFALSLVQTIVPLFGARLNNQRLMAVGGPVAVTGFALTALSFVALASAYASSDFSVASVWENSHSLQPLLYKITGVWGNHEGSMLLWVLILTLLRRACRRLRRPTCRRRCGACAGRAGLRSAPPSSCSSWRRPTRSSGSIRRRSKATTSTRSCRISASPSIRRCSISAMSASRSASPSAVAALIEGRIDAAWARWVRPWTLVAWMFLTVGIAMGSYWAYYELGWGGFWFWDPVENASLHAVAGGHGAAPFGHRHGKARRAEDLDDPARHPHLLAVAARHLPGALGRADLGARLRHRSDARHLHPRASSTLFIGGALSLFALRAGAADGRRPVRADQPRGRAGPQQSVPDRGRRDGARRHALSAGAGGADRRQDLGRRAVLQPDLRAADGAAADHGAVRAAAGLEARRPLRRRAAPDGRLRRGAVWQRWSPLCSSTAPSVLAAARRRPWRLADRSARSPNLPSGSGFGTSRRPISCQPRSLGLPRSASARRSPMPASA